nr:DMT family transporter [Alsobacter ponti]
MSAFVALALIWGLSFLVILRIVAAFGFVGAVSFRAFVAGATLLIVAALTRRRLSFGGARWRQYATVGATTVAGQLIGLNYATPRIGTAMAAILVASIPLFSMVIAQAWGLERMTPARLVGLGFGLLGIVMLVGFPPVEPSWTFLLGCLCGLAASFSAAFGSVYASRALRKVGAWEVTIAAFLFGGAMTLPLLALVPVPGWPRPVDYLYLLIAGCLMSALTYTLYFRLVATIGATRAISVEFAVTLVAVLVGALALDEPISAMQLAGAACVVLGCALVLGLAPGRFRSS